MLREHSFIILAVFYAAFLEAQSEGTGFGLTPSDYERAKDAEIKDSKGFKSRDDEVQPDEMQDEDGNIRVMAKPWPGAKIYYMLRDKRNTKEGFSDENIADIAAAICLIERRSCIRFIHDPKAKNFISIYKHDQVCDSPVGFQGGNQSLRLTPGKGKCFDVPGSAAHELLHASGFWHEQSRSDRAKFVKVNLANVPLAKRHNFDIHPQPPPAATYAGNVPYDLTSLMQYHRYAFTNKRADGTYPQSMTPLNDYGQELGQRKDLTPSDALRLNIYYKCKKDKAGKWTAAGVPVPPTQCPPLRQILQ